MTVIRPSPFPDCQQFCRPCNACRSADFICDPACRLSPHVYRQPLLSQPELELYACQSKWRAQSSVDFHPPQPVMVPTISQIARVCILCREASLASQSSNRTCTQPARPPHGPRAVHLNGNKGGARSSCARVSVYDVSVVLVATHQHVMTDKRRTSIS